MAPTSYFEILAICLILLLPFLYETSHVFRYYFKFVIYVVVVSFNAIILIPAMLCRPCDVRNLLWASSFCHHVSTILGLKWELRGKEHLEKDQACIIVANHQSSLDVLGMFDIWPVMNKCTVVAKREILYVWPFGLAAWLCGLIFINRMQTDRAREQLSIAANLIKSKGIKLWVFPEGTRRNTGELHPFRKGAFHVALDGQIPILPVVFSSYRTFLDDKTKRLNSGKVIISALPPIPTQGLGKADLDTLMQHTYDIMNVEYQRISNEVHDELRIVQQQQQQQQQQTKNVSMAAAVNGTTATVSDERVPFLLDDPNVFNQYSFMPARKSVPTTAN